MIGLGQLKHRRSLGRALIAGSLIAIWLLSTHYIAALLLDSLKPPPVELSGKEADAIVILGGGSNRGSIEYGGDSVSAFTLERIRYGAWLARKLHKPILVTGGGPAGGSAEGDIMRASLEQEFDLNVRWVEAASSNTRENARMSSRLLKEAGIERIYLVTHAWHLARAVPEFESMGFKVIPAGTGYSLPEKPGLLDFVPNAKAFYNSWLALHEWIGLLWYRIRY